MDASSEERREGVFTFVLANRTYAIAALVCMVAGAWLSYEFLTEDLSATRRILGGAVGGFLSWLLVLVGRVMGE